MSLFHDFTRHKRKEYKYLNYVVGERIRTACIYRGYSLKEGASKCNIEYNKFLKYVNGKEKIPKEKLFNIMKGLQLPKKFFMQEEVKS